MVKYVSGIPGRFLFTQKKEVFNKKHNGGNRMKKFKSLFSSIIVFTMLAVFLVACSADKDNGSETQAPTTAETQAPTEETSSTDDTDSAGESATIIDPAGNEINIPDKTDRIISLAPSITEVLVELGFGDNIILVDANSKDLAGLPEGIEYVDMMTPDVEKMIALEPDIVLASTITVNGGTDPADQLAAADITLAYIPSSDSIEGIYSDIMFIAQVLKVEDKGQDLVDNTKTEISKIAEIGETIEEKKSVYFEIGAAPSIYSFGQGVFLNEMIEIIGANNVLVEEDGWVSVSEEAAVAADPDVILTNVNYIEDPEEEIKSRAGWENMKAIKNDDIYYIDNMSSSLPNHNIIKALKEMAQAVYPDKY